MMKIKGVRGGTQRGEVIEYNPEEKTIKTVLDHIPTLSPDLNTWFALNVKVDKVEITARFPLNEKGFANNVYHAVGTYDLKITVGMNQILPSRPQKFEITFKDILNNNGLPETEVTEFTSSNV